MYWGRISFLIPVSKGQRNRMRKKADWKINHPNTKKPIPVRLEFEHIHDNRKKPTNKLELRIYHSILQPAACATPEPLYVFGNFSTSAAGCGEALDSYHLISALHHLLERVNLERTLSTRCCLCPPTLSNPTNWILKLDVYLSKRMLLGRCNLRSSA